MVILLADVAAVVAPAGMSVKAPISSVFSALVPVLITLSSVPSSSN